MDLIGQVADRAADRKHRVVAGDDPAGGHDPLVEEWISTVHRAGDHHPSGQMTTNHPAR
jgi:hypothetical protein